MTIRMIELFAVIGAQASAMERIGVDHECVAVCEIDERAYRVYCALHGDVPNLGDITKVEHLPECDLLTYSSPCQDLSSAGIQRGFEEGSGTRSSLLWEVGRLLDDMKERGCLPDCLVFENVPAILHEKFRPGFEMWCRRLEGLGYINSYAVVDARDHGVPQSRRRVFMVSSLTKGKFIFPEKRPLDIRLKDVLEKDVPESFYLSEERLAKYERHAREQAAKGNGFGFRPLDAEREGVECADDQPESLRDIGFSEGPGELDPNGCDKTRKIEVPDNRVTDPRERKSGLVLTGLLMDVDFVYDRKVYSPDAIAPTVEAQGKPPRIEVDGSLTGPNGNGSGLILAGRLTDLVYKQTYRVFDPEGVSPTVAAEVVPPKIEIPEERPNEVIRVDNETYSRYYVYSGDGVSPCLRATDYKDPLKVVVKR